jgi:hypothetical protein
MGEGLLAGEEAMSLGNEAVAYAVVR